MELQFDELSKECSSKMSTTSDQSYEPPKRLKPFKPNSFTYSLDSADKLFIKPKPPIVKNTILPDKDFENLIDAETGAIIEVTKAKWNVKEGRLNMDARAILAMGTGQLDIKNKAVRERSTAQNSQNNSTFLPPLQLSNNNSPARNTHSKSSSLLQPQQQQRNSIVTKFLLEGPQNPRFHRYWNKRSDSVDLNADTIGDISEEGVDYYGYDAPYKQQLTDTQALLLQQQEEGTAGEDTQDDIQSKFIGVPHGTITEHSTSHSNVNSPHNSSRDGYSSRRGSRNISPMSKHSSAHHLLRKANTMTSILTDTDLRSVASHDSSKVSKRSKAGVNQVCTHVDPKIRPTNTDNWAAVEEKIFQEVFGIASAMETNKSLTLEAPQRGGMVEVRRVCRQLARLKTKGLKEVVFAVEDERVKEEMRDKALLDIAYKPQAAKDLLVKTHNEERKKARLYFTALQTDNEIMFVHKMYEAGYLW